LIYARLRLLQAVFPHTRVRALHTMLKPGSADSPGLAVSTNMAECVVIWFKQQRRNEELGRCCR